MRNIVCSTLPEAVPYSFYAWTENVMERCDENVFYLSKVVDYRVPG